MHCSRIVIRVLATAIGTGWWWSSKVWNVSHHPFLIFFEFVYPRLVSDQFVFDTRIEFDFLDIEIARDWSTSRDNIICRPSRGFVPP